MANIIDYVKTEMAPFSVRPLNDVDSLIFSQLAYFRIGETFPDAVSPQGRALRDLYQAEHMKQLCGDMRDEQLSSELVSALAASPRFREVRVCLYVNEIDTAIEMQFCGMVFYLPDVGAYAAFRGTDSTLVGWREDFNLAMQYPVPSQEEAAHFLVRAAKYPGNLYVGGHSKGGNLATYAAFNCDDEIKQRILNVFDHDGPGFPETVVNSDQFTTIRPIVRKSMPQGSVVGMLFNSVEPCLVVKSDAFGIYQHDPYSWQVDLKTLDFESMDKVDDSAEYSQHAIDEWIASMDDNARHDFTDAVFSVLGSEGNDSIPEETLAMKLALVTKALAVSDEATRATILDRVGSLVKIAMTPQGKVADAMAALTAAANRAGQLNLPQQFKVVRSKEESEPEGGEA